MVTKQNRKGFTLIELLVVIAIIGLLSTLAIVALGNAQTRARDAKRLADVKQIQTALALYYNAKTYYPFEINTGAGEILGAAAAAKLNDDDTFTTAADASTPTYLATVPADPSQTAVCTRGAAAFPGTLAAPAAGCAYTYWSNGTAAGAAGNNTQFELGFSLELGSSGLAAGIHCATEGGISGALCSH